MEISYENYIDYIKAQRPQYLQQYLNYQEVVSEESLQQLNVIVSSFVGFKVNLENKTIDNNRGAWHFKLLDEQNLTETNPLFRAMWKTAHLHSFYFEVSDNDVDEDLVYIQISLRHESRFGGSNGEPVMVVKKQRSTKLWVVVQ